MTTLQAGGLALQLPFFEMERLLGELCARVTMR
jgi:hypothetical protein